MQSWWLGEPAHGSRSSWTGEARGTAAWRGLHGISVSVSPLPPNTHTHTHTHQSIHTVYTHTYTHPLYHSHRSSTLVTDSSWLVTPSVFFALTDCVLYIYIFISSPRKRILAWERQRGSVWNGVGEAEWPRAQVAAVLWLLCQVMVDGRMDAPHLSLILCPSIRLSLSCLCYILLLALFCTYSLCCFWMKYPSALLQNADMLCTLHVSTLCIWKDCAQSLA